MKKMKENQYSITEVAAAVGVTRQALYNWYRLAAQNPNSKYAELLPKFEGTYELPKYLEQEQLEMICDFAKLSPTARRKLLDEKNSEIAKEAGSYIDDIEKILRNQEVDPIVMKTIRVLLEREATARTEQVKEENMPVPVCIDAPENARDWEVKFAKDLTGNYIDVPKNVGNMFHEMVNSLSDTREKQIAIELWLHGKTLRQVGKELGLSHERIRQMKLRMVTDFRKMAAAA